MDFVVAEASAIQRQWLEYRCYFTGLHRNGRMIAMNTCIIVENMFWLECSWRKHHGVHRVKTYKEIVDLLMDEYDADEARTLEYDQMKTIGMNDTQFLHILKNLDVSCLDVLSLCLFRSEIPILASRYHALFSCG